MDMFIDTWHQMFPPTATLTEANLPSQTGRVFIVTGGYAGVGKELSRILYRHHGTVYIAGRSHSKATAAITEFKETIPSSDGRLEFLHLDLADLPSIKTSAEEFLRREQRLDVLTNNAGVMGVPVGTKDATGFEMAMGTNCLGPYLFTQLLTPLLQKTAASSPPNSVRVTWAASLGTLGSPKNGVEFDSTTSAPRVHNNPTLDYMQTKSGNVFLAREYQKQPGNEAIISNAWNPGNLLSELQRHKSWLFRMTFYALLYRPVYGAYTELWAGWAEEAGGESGKGAYIGPWGRFVALRRDVDEGSVSGRFVEWCEKETRAYR